MKIYPEKEDTKNVKTIVNYDEKADALYMRKDISGFGVKTKIKEEHIDKYAEVHKKFRGKYPTPEEMQQEIIRSACGGCTGCNFLEQNDE